MTLRPLPGPGLRAGMLLLGSTAWACCVAPPSPRDLLAVGFRTPEQTFATFRTAVRADEPGLVRRSFSADFVRRNALSEFAAREFWESLQRDHPLLRKGVADARIEAPPEVRRDLARLVAVSHGRRIQVDLVREDFCEAWEGAEKRADEAASFPERTGVQAAEDGRRWMYGNLPLPDGVEAARITELRFGREWKIDGFEVVEEDPRARDPGREPGTQERRQRDELP